MNLLQSKSTATMSSREIATLTGKEHKNVIRVIDHAKDAQILTGNIEPLDFIHRGNTYKHYELNKKDSLYVVARLSPEFTMNIIDRWEELEGISQPSWIANLSPQATIAIEDMSRQIECLADKIQVDAPKVEFVDKFVSVGESKTFREVAAILGVRSGYLMSCLKARKIVYKNHKDNEYKAYSEFAKYFETKVGIANDKEYSQLRVNCEGVIYLSRKLGSNENKVVAI